MTAFAGLVDQLFADPNLGRDATWEPADGDPFPVRVIARRADAITDFGEARLWSETTRFDPCHAAGARGRQRLTAGFQLSDCRHWEEPRVRRHRSERERCRVIACSWTEPSAVALDD